MVKKLKVLAPEKKNQLKIYSFVVAAFVLLQLAVINSTLQPRNRHFNSVSAEDRPAEQCNQENNNCYNCDD